MEVLENKDTSGKTAKEWIVLQNIRSLTKNVDEFKIFISQTEVEPVAICLTETWLKNSFESECFSLQNYLKIETSNRKKRGGGVGIFVHKKATKKTIASVDTNSLQAISLEIKFCDKTYLVTCVYIPPNATKAETFEELSSYIDQISITPSTLHIVCGDRNVNILKKLAKSTLIINQMEMNALALVDPQTATRETIRTKTCIDVFFTNFKTKSFVEKTKISDHYTVGLELIKKEKVRKVFKY